MLFAELVHSPSVESKVDSSRKRQDTEHAQRCQSTQRLQNFAIMTECILSALLVGAEAGGARTVGVFVDEAADVISERSTAAGLSYVQLHGDDAREALPNLPADTKVIFVLGATPDGVVRTLLPSQISAESSRLVCAFASGYTMIALLFSTY